MNRKPVIYRGRFYNSHEDSIARRVRDFIKAVWLIGKHRMFSKLPPEVKQSDFLAEWVTAPAVSHSQQQPTFTWCGHATFLIQFCGLNILTDPVFFDISWFFKRKVQAPILINSLPKIDIILISHNHCDHLDLPSLLYLKDHNPRIFVPLGNKQWLERQGFTLVEEFNWGQSITLDKAVTCTFLPAHHWTSRGIFDINKTLWGSWMISGAKTKLYFVGDSAYDRHFAEIGYEFGPIDIVFMPIGPDQPRHLMNSAHVGVDQALQAFDDLDGKQCIPMHWGTFRSGLDRFTDLVTLLKTSWHKRFKKNDRVLRIMKFGQTLTIKN